GLGCTRVCASVAHRAGMAAPGVADEGRGASVGGDERNAMEPHAVAAVLDKPLSRELLARDITRLAYVAVDGTPRSIPIGFSWNGSELVMCTPPNAPKIPALQQNPAVAL